MSDTLAAVHACGSLLSRAIAASPPGAVSWHYGRPTDPSGFAAMGAAETLLHTYDITQGPVLNWLPPRSLCSAILARTRPRRAGW